MERFYLSTERSKNSKTGIFKQDQYNFISKKSSKFKLDWFSNRVELYIDIIDMEIPNPSLQKIHKYFLKTGQTIAVAESCTGGLLSFWLTSLPDSSKYFKGGLVSYATDIKVTKLGLDPDKIKKEGLVTEDCVEEMAQGVKCFFQTDWAVSITGIAGPAKGFLDEPVGKVAFSVVSKEFKKSSIKHFEGSDRKDIRHQASLFALDFLLFGLKC